MKNTIAFIRRNKRHIPAVALVLGLVWDSFLLGHPDSFFANVILLAWLVTSLGCITLLSLRKKKHKEEPLFLLSLLQFAFGNLAGSLIVLYAQSGTLEGSILFFIILGSFLVGNEFLKTRYARIQFHIAAWYLLLLAYLVLVLPILLKETSTKVFIFSGIGSIALVVLFLFLLNKITKEGMSGRIKQALGIVAAIYIAFNTLYFLNLIPPVPLSIKTVGVYHSVVKKTNGSYSVTLERPNFLEVFRDTSTVFHTTKNSSAYCFSSIYAPSGISAPIYHRWEYFDATKNTWVNELRVAFPIIGGRDTGYRGYSIKSGITEGKWRCSVETESGALIGRITFTVVFAKSPTLHTKVF